MAPAINHSSMKLSDFPFSCQHLLLVLLLISSFSIHGNCTNQPTAAAAAAVQTVHHDTELLHSPNHHRTTHTAHALFTEALLTASTSETRWMPLSLNSTTNSDTWTTASEIAISIDGRMGLSLNTNSEPSRLVRTIAIRIQFHPNRFFNLSTIAINNTSTTPTPTSTSSSSSSNIHSQLLSIWMGDDRLLGDRVARYSSAATMDEREAMSLQIICFGSPTAPEIQLAQSWMSQSNLILESSLSSPFNDTSCILQVITEVFSNEATIAIRTQMESGSLNDSISSFIASYLLLTDCPDAMASSDSIPTYAHDALTLPNDSLTQPFCAPKFQFDRRVQVGVYTVIGVVLLIQTFFMCFIYYYRRHVVMIGASVPFLLCMIGGLGVITISAITWSLEPNDISVCHARLWTLCMGFILTMSTFIVKTQRVREIYTAHSLRRNLLSTKQMILLVVLFFAAQLILLITVTVGEWFHFERRLGNGASAGQIISICYPTSRFVPWLVIEALFVTGMVIKGAMNALAIRRAAVAFNETKSASATLFVFILFIAICLPLQDSLTGHPNAQLIIMGLGISVCSCIQSLGTMANKFYYIYYGKGDRIIRPDPRTKMSIPAIQGGGITPGPREIPPFPHHQQHPTPPHPHPPPPKQPSSPTNQQPPSPHHLQPNGLIRLRNPAGVGDMDQTGVGGVDELNQPIVPAFSREKSSSSGVLLAAPPPTLLPQNHETGPILNSDVGTGDQAGVNMYLPNYAAPGSNISNGEPALAPAPIPQWTDTTMRLNGPDIDVHPTELLLYGVFFFIGLILFSVYFFLV